MLSSVRRVMISSLHRIKKQCFWTLGFFEDIYNINLVVNESNYLLGLAVDEVLFVGYLHRLEQIIESRSPIRHCLRVKLSDVKRLVELRCSEYCPVWVELINPCTFHH